MCTFFPDFVAATANPTRQMYTERLNNTPMGWASVTSAHLTHILPSNRFVIFTACKTGRVKGIHITATKKHMYK